MSDFVQTMKDWKRMHDSMNKYGTRDCLNCPLYGCSCSDIFKMPENMDYLQLLQETIATWASEHPEPVYPTWAELLIEMGLAEHKTVFFNECCADGSYITTFDDVLSKAAYKPIQADIAEKLGLKPKRKENDV